MNPTFVRKVLTIVLVLVVLGAIGAIVYNSINPSHKKTLTEFYLLGASGKAEGYTTTAKVGVPVTVTLGIHNEENISTTYRIEVKINGVKTQDIGPVALADGQTWEESAGVTFTAPGNNQTAEFYLYISDGTEPYLSPLKLNVDVGE
jgi:uncharacterized membrane protein